MDGVQEVSPVRSSVFDSAGIANRSGAGGGGHPLLGSAGGAVDDHRDVEFVKRIKKGGVDLSASTPPREGGSCCFRNLICYAGQGGRFGSLKNFWIFPQGPN